MDRWPVFCRLFPRALTVRRMAALLDVHPETSFRWRHRLLDSLRRTEAPTLSARVSVDLGWLPYSTKGVRAPEGPGARLRVSAGLPRRTAWLILACDPTAASFARFVGETCPGWPRIRNVLAGRIRAGAVLLHRTNRKLRVAPAAAALGLSSEPEGAAWDDEERGDPEPARFHLVRYREWEQRFRGIATRYLDNYLVWFRLVELARRTIRRRHRLEPILCGTFPPRQSG